MDRFREPSTWASLAAGAAAVAAIYPAWALYCAIVAAVSSLAGIVLREKGV